MISGQGFLLNQQIEEDSIFIDDLPLCKFLLMNDSNYPWFLLIPRIDNIKELYDLSESNRAQLDFETVEVSKFIQSSFKPEKINIASLGNIVPQFHVHIIARYMDDISWPNPVWGKFPFNKYKSDQSERLLKVSKIFSNKLKNQA
jgi:diadenosine tetraphosphate (Ap4A) HIT family hydrolase